MNNQVITLDIEQFIFASDDTLKTTSLKIAEKFGKLHKNVLRDIERILTQVSDSFGKLNFELSEYEQPNNLGLMTKHPMYNLTKDGFVMVAMGFTGKEAMAIKEAYINAFNLMYDKLFPRYGQRPLDPPTITKAQQGELFTLAHILSGSNGKTRVAVWSRFANHFRISSYKDLPYEKYQEGIDYLERLRVLYGNKVEMVFVPKHEYDELKQAKQVEGELMDKVTHRHNTITIAINDELSYQRYLVTRCGDVTTLFAVPDDYITGYKDEVIKKLGKDAIENLRKTGFIVGKKEDVIELLKNSGYVVIEKERLRWTNLDQINKLIA